MTQQPVLTARGLTKRYGRVTALNNCEFDLYPGEILAVIGDNGAGKSTLIKAISGAVIADEGTIELDGKQVQFRSPIEAREAGIERIFCWRSIRCRDLHFSGCRLVAGDCRAGSLHPGKPSHLLIVRCSLQRAKNWNVVHCARTHSLGGSAPKLLHKEEL